MIQTCQRCRWFNAGELQCRRHAPIRVLKQDIDLNGNDSNAFGKWPIVFSDYWCGDWELNLVEQQKELEDQQRELTKAYATYTPGKGNVIFDPSMVPSHFSIDGDKVINHQGEHVGNIRSDDDETKVRIEE